MGSGRSLLSVAQQPVSGTLRFTRIETASKQEAAATDIMCFPERPARMKMRSGVYAFAVRRLFEASAWGGGGERWTVGLFNVSQRYNY